MLHVLISPLLPVKVDWEATVETVVFNIRLPRVLLAMCIGASLSISGAAFQGMFQNPLVSPDILGVTAGAGFGAALGILLSGSVIVIQLFALAFGILAVVLTYLISRVYRTTPTLMLVLSGIVVGSIFGALLSLTKYVADPQQKLPAIVFWLMGSLATVSKRDVVYACPPMLLGMGILLLLRWRVNLLSMGDDEARALGVNPDRLKAVLITACTVATAAGVSVSGIIGWVGLVIPHLGRMLVGPDHRSLMPVSLALGAMYLVVIDDLARSLMAAEIPLGILTAIVGAPFFAVMLRRTRGGWA
jgi:iron complex transport system permease protein